MKETTLRISEIFGGTPPEKDVIPVIQGEGRHVGMPSIFVRLFGCNLRCPGFGVPNYQLGTKNPEVKEIVANLVKFKTLDSLPRVQTGCDTYYAVYPEFKQFTKNYTVPELIAEIERRSYTIFKPPHLVFTGGEPLLWQKQLILVFDALNKTKIEQITFETNGILELTKEFIHCLNSSRFTITWSVSPKLSCAGHSTLETINSSALRTYNQVKSELYLKFVVDKSPKTYDELLKFVKQYSFDGVDIDDVYLMPEGGDFDRSNYVENRQYVVSLCHSLGFKYSPRLQVELFNNVVGS